mgnify:CR=1 FL=1
MHPRVVATTAVRMLVRMIVMMSVHALAPHVLVSMFAYSLALCEIVIDRFHDEYPFEPTTHGWRKFLSLFRSNRYRLNIHRYLFFFKRANNFCTTAPQSTIGAQTYPFGTKFSPFEADNVGKTSFSC